MKATAARASWVSDDFLTMALAWTAGDRPRFLPPDVGVGTMKPSGMGTVLVVVAAVDVTVSVSVCEMVTVSTRGQRLALLTELASCSHPGTHLSRSSTQSWLWCC